MGIRLLPPEVSALIAAGEVIERPVSVIKELIENAMDADASRIRIETLGGGLESMFVVDNGCGIGQKEMGLAFQRFSTSKVYTVSDLEDIQTLGFRGEALYSIAAVAEIHLESRERSSSHGARIVVNQGTVLDQGPAAVGEGTLVRVNRLFQNFPARLKFLKSARSESGRIQALLHRLAIVNPKIAFELRQERSRPFITSGSDDLRDVMAVIYGHQFARMMIPINSLNDEQSRGGCYISGIIGMPEQTRANRSHINLSVNGRWFRSRTLTYAFEQAYHGFIEGRRFPVGSVHIRVPNEDVDVNIHPTKLEVQFKYEDLVFSTIRDTVRQALLDFSSVPSVNVNTTTKDVSFYTKPLGDMWPSIFLDNRVNDGNPVFSASDIDVAKPEKNREERLALPPRDTLPLLRVLGQISNSYIVSEGPDGVYLVDQHAAHERIIYDEISNGSLNETPPTQTLMEPVLIDLDDSQISTFTENRELFSKLGVDYEPFGNNTILIRAIPTLLSEANPTQAITGILEALDEGSLFETWDEKAAYSVACHAAIRAGKSLSTREMELLLRQLESCVQPNTCPHGRPTLVRISLQQLERYFSRR